MTRVSVSKTVKRFTGSLPPTVLGRFERFVALLESLYGVSLSRHTFTDCGNLNKFCSGLIEGDGTHPWRSVVRGLSAQSRFGFAHSLFLFRKVIPKEKPRVEQYVTRLASPQEAPDPAFKDFAIKQVRKLFPFGWDKSYVGHCLASSLPVKACAEASRGSGGSRGWEAELRWDRTEFCDYVLDSVLPAPRGVSRVKAIETGGKWRVISIPPRIDNALRPLHKAIYSHLSRFPWLLRGDAKQNNFKDFTVTPGEIFVSGDYESATDNLNSDLQVAILDELLMRAESVPQGIAAHVRSSYSSVLTYDGSDREFVQARGQLMGQLTSFPLLCLVNYITFRYSIRRSVPVRINGDDIVFRATPEETLTWERNVAKGGLTLSKGKTLMHSRAFTLNSTPFWATSGRPKLVGFVRSSALFKQAGLSELIQSLNGRFYSACAGYGRERRSLVREAFVDFNQKPILASRRSLTRGLGLAVDRKLLHSSGMWHRELFYLEQVEERPIPQFARGELPKGWARVSRSCVSLEDRKYWEREWGWACVSHAWCSSFDPSDFTEQAILDYIRDGCSPYGLGVLAGSRVRRMLGLTRSQLWAWVYRRSNESVFGRVRWSRGEGVWVEVDQLASRSLVFVKARSCGVTRTLDVTSSRL
jgi:hypothetical protein